MMKHILVFFIVLIFTCPGYAQSVPELNKHFYLVDLQAVGNPQDDTNEASRNENRILGCKLLPSSARDPAQTHSVIFGEPGGLTLL